MSKRKWLNPTNTLTYNSWRSMRNRILFDSSPNHRFYKDKNITICIAWKDNYDAFFKDMGERPISTTLDRIDPDGNYEPNNCRWATHRQQQNNKYGLTKIEHNGVIKTIGEWCHELGINRQDRTTVYKRHSKYGASSFEELFTNHLLTHRVNNRHNECLVCARTESIKWRKDGKLCNTCYHRGLRWAKRTSNNIDEYHEWPIGFKQAEE